MMETSEIGYSPNEDQGVQAFIRTLNSLRNDFLQKIKQYTECLREKIFLISISSISLLIVLFFYTFAIYLQPIIFVDFNKHVMSKTMLKPSIVSSIQEPYIYSKNQYFNRTRKPSENVIAFLVASFAGDIRRAYNPYPKLGEKLFQLDERL
ncbi:unnamed protein product, partial [Rotaria socialis]